MSARDHALEDILFKYQYGISHIVSVLKEQTESIAAHLNTKNHGRQYAKMNREMFEKRLTPWFNMGITQAESLIKQMRASVYALSYAGHAEAIGRGTGKETTASLSKSDVQDEKSRESLRGGDILARIELAFHRLLRDIIDAYQLSQVLESPPEEVLARIDRAFPATKKIPKRAKMTRMTEAAKKKPDEYDISAGVIDPETWDQAVSDYTDEYLPFGRSPDDKVFYPVDYASDLDQDTVQGYQWELEQEVMNDFVQSVRNGEDDAANDNGITDMMWIAIIDSKTDECCSLRDGLSTKEIQGKLDNGDYMGDCDAVNAPAHFNCRCRMSPMTEALAQSGEQPQYADFDSWLQQRGEEG